MTELLMFKVDVKNVMEEGRNINPIPQYIC